jgi:putative nucleotidyltransferase with HDIG domain
MNSADVFAQIERMGDLPSLPRTLLSIQRVATDERSSAEDLAACILADQALTMRVLKVVNSVMYRTRHDETVRTVHRAVIVLGFETVRKLALGLSVFDMMSKLSRSPVLADIARHSLATAAMAQVLAEESHAVPAEEAFVIALLHDIGKVVLVECSPAAMDAALADATAGVPTIEAERRHFGLSHDRAGRRLAERWQLPAEIQNVIGDHHDIDPLRPPQRLDPMLAVIVFANALSRFGEHDVAAAGMLQRAARTHGIPSARLETLHRRLHESVANLAGCLGLEVGDLAAYGDVVNVAGSASIAPRRLDETEIARRTARLLELYRQVGQSVARGEDPDELVQAVLDGAVEILGFERVVLLRRDRGARHLQAWAWAGIEAGPLASRLTLPLRRRTGPLALAAIRGRTYHVPAARSEAYGDLAGADLLEAARCNGYAVAPVLMRESAIGVLYGDGGPDGQDVSAEQASELAGLALQIGLICGTREVSRV